MIFKPLLQMSLQLDLQCIKQNTETKINRYFLKQEIPIAVAKYHFRGTLFGSREWRCKYHNKLGKEKCNSRIHIPKWIMRNRVAEHRHRCMHKLQLSFIQLAASPREHPTYNRNVPMYFSATNASKKQSG